MTDECADVLINDLLISNGDVSGDAAPRKIGSDIIAAAEGVLSAARSSGRLDAECVLQKVIELLRAVEPSPSV